MNPLVPAYLPPYVITGTAAIAAGLLFGLNRVLKRAEWPDQERRRSARTLAAILVAWALVSLLLTWLGFYHGTSSRIPMIPFGILLPIAVGIVLFARWSLLRRVIDAVPQHWIVAVQLYRALGLIFVVLYAAGRLPGVFALPAGIGDFVVGLMAPVVGFAYASRWSYADGLVRAWNWFGLGDLLVAVATGFLTSPSPVQTLALNAPNELISAFPLAMVPVFLVPLSVLLHLASLRKLRQSQSRDEALQSLLAGQKS